MRLTSGLMCAAAVIALSAVACTTDAPAPKSSPAVAAAAVASEPPFKTAVRRITESQYRHAAADIFGPDIKINARFEPEKREDGLIAIGSSTLSITTSGLEQYYALATSISEQVLDPKRRDASVGCKPADATKPDAACAGQFVRSYGDRLFRRPMTDAEVAARVATAGKGAEQSGDFYHGLRLALTSLLVAPEFLFRVEMAESDPAKAGQYRLDGYTKAARLSYLFWDTTPDAELLAAARDGSIHTGAGLTQQLTRLSASPRLQDGARAFFTDMLQLEAFETLTKDPLTYPKFSQAVADSAREETLKSVVDLLVNKQADYRDTFTTRATFINRPLAAVYQVPFKSTEEWAAYTFPETAERSGVLTQVTFLSLFAHPARSSPTRRGVKLHEIFMCQPTPEPPADVDFSKVQAVENGTVRTRLIDHMTNEGCATCHRVSDPAGLTLEHFDGLGQLRKTENGALIDVSADIGGTKFTGAQGLGRMLHDNPRVPGCLVRNVYYYGVGRPSDDRDEAYLAAQTKAFAADGYKLPGLMTRIAESPEFFKVVKPAGVRRTPEPAKAASNDTASTGEGR